MYGAAKQQLQATLDEIREAGLYKNERVIESPQDARIDVGMEMSGNPQAFRDMIANMAHGGNVGFLGIPSDEFAINWKTVIFNMLTVKGIYGREMYETWYQMSVLLEGGLDISPIITHRFSYKEFEKGFEVMKSGDSGKVVLDWSEI